MKPSQNPGSVLLAAASPKICVNLRNLCFNTRLILIPLAVLVCWLIDVTPIALPLEADLAARASFALQTVLRGLGLDDTLRCVVAPECSGLRTAVALALIMAWRCPSMLKGICVAIPCGLGLNLWRIFICELALRYDPVLGDFCHTFALPVILLPTFFVVSRSWSHLARTPRLVLGTLAAELFMLLFILLPEAERALTITIRN